MFGSIIRADDYGEKVQKGKRAENKFQLTVSPGCDNAKFCPCVFQLREQGFDPGERSDEIGAFLFFFHPGVYDGGNTLFFYIQVPENVFAGHSKGKV